MKFFYFLFAVAIGWIALKQATHLRSLPEEPGQGRFTRTAVDLRNDGPPIVDEAPATGAVTAATPAQITAAKATPVPKKLTDRQELRKLEVERVELTKK